MKLYKLTEQDGTTRNNIQWDVGIVHKVEECEQPELCSGDVLHAYKNINLAFLLNPIHANIYSPKLFEVEGDICVEDYGKVGCFSLDVTRELEIPVWTNSSYKKKVQVMFAILCAESVLYVWNIYNTLDTRVVDAIEAAREYLRTGDAAYAADAARAAADAADARAIDFCYLADEAVRFIES